MNKKLPRSHFLVKSDHFKNTYGGKRIENSSFIIYSNDNCEEFSRIAVVVSKKFGKSVKKSRIAKGLSQKDLACSAQINQSDVSLIEEGRKNITFKTLFKICKALEIKNIEI